MNGQVESPEVLEDGRVVFRLRAPEANKVEVRLETAGTLAMTKDGRGLWSVTSKALTPDYYVYALVVDGVSMKDPGNPLIKFNLFNTESQVHVPGPASLPWESNDVAHGVFGQGGGIDDHGVLAAGFGDQRRDRAVACGQGAGDRLCRAGRASKGDPAQARVGQ